MKLQPATSINEIETRVKVISKSFNKKTFLHMECQCGKQFSMRKDYVDRLYKNNKPITCGCQRVYLEKDQHFLWSGFNDISGFYFSSFRCKAKRKKIIFDITIEDIWNIYLKQDKLCNLSKVPVFFSKSRKKEEQTASIDRIDSSKGYTVDNIQIVHKNINLMKNVLTQPDFVNWCKLVSMNN